MAAFGHPVTGRCVRQQPARVADQAEHQRVLAGKMAARRGDVQRQAAPEPGQRTGQRAAGQGQRRHFDQHQIRS
jgi:hypothetical protein